MKTKLKMAFGAVAIAGMTAALALQHRTTVTLQTENQRLQQTTAQCCELREQNQQLSNLVAQGSAHIELPEDQMRELLRLRGQVNRLRKQREEYEKGRAGESRARAAESGQAGAPGARDGQVPPEILSRESLKFSGYAQPRAAFQTHMWAALNAALTGDGKAVLESFTPEARAQWLETFKTEEGVAAQFRRTWAGITGFRILSEQAVSADETLLSVYVEGRDVVHRACLKRIGSDWKFDREQGLN